MSIARYERLEALPLLPASPPSKRVGGLITAIREISANRQLLDLLVRRDLKSRYKDSALGFVWTLIRPITQLIVYYVVLGQFLGAARGIPDFAVYIFTGLTIYGLFSEIVAGGTGSIVGNSGLIKKVYVPREIFPLASVGSALFNFVVQLVVLFAATAIFNVFPMHAKLLYFIPSVAIILIYGLAFALLLAALNVFLRDIQYLSDVVLMLLMWASPIVYSWSAAANQFGNSILLDIYTNNPITLAVLGFHKAFWINGAPEEYPPDLILRMGIAMAVGLIVLLLCHRVFAKLQGDFAQEL